MFSAAAGVLKAAANAAEHPTGTRVFTLTGLKSEARANYGGDPRADFTDGPSRPSAMPLARDAEQQTNLPSTVREEM